jgi:hypothetical protein
MSDNLESIDKSEKRGTVQRNETGNERPTATSLRESKEKAEYYKEADGGATH